MGTALALLSGLLASLLIPALTRVWQDRPKELALKRALVHDISQSATSAIAEAKYSAITRRGARRPDPEALYARMNRRWTVQSALIAAELTTYFPGSRAAGDWKHFIPVVTRYLGAAAFIDVPSKRQHHLSNLKDFLYRISWARHLPLAASPSQDPRDAVRYAVSLTLYEVRDGINAEIISTPATGFSHGWWIFK